MPSYTFINSKTKEEKTEIMTISEMEEYLEKNPHITTKITAPAIIDPWSAGRQKVPSGFTDVLKKIKKANRRSTIETGNLTAI